MDVLNVTEGAKVSREDDLSSVVRIFRISIHTRHSSKRAHFEKRIIISKHMYW